MRVAVNVVVLGLGVGCKVLVRLVFNRIWTSAVPEVLTRFEGERPRKARPMGANVPAVTVPFPSVSVRERMDGKDVTATLYEISSRRPAEHLHGLARTAHSVKSRVPSRKLSQLALSVLLPVVVFVVRR